MMEMIYKKKMAYFESGGDDDWKEILARTYPKEPPPVTPPKYNKEQERACLCDHLARRKRAYSFFIFGASNVMSTLRHWMH